MKNKSGPEGREGLQEKGAGESSAFPSRGQGHVSPGAQVLHPPLLQGVGLAWDGLEGFG